MLRNRFILTIILVVFVFISLRLTCRLHEPYVDIIAQPDSVPSGGTVSLLIEVEDGDFPEDTVTCTLNCTHGVFSDTIVVFCDTIGKSVTWTAPDTLQDTVSYDTITVFATDIYDAQSSANTVIKVYEDTTFKNYKH